MITSQDRTEGSQDSQPIDLTNQFLMAMPGMMSGPFAGTVVYVCEHSGKGALGLVINRPTDLTLATLLEKIDLKLDSPESPDSLDSPVYFGGPVQTDRGFVLHQPAGNYSSSLALSNMALTTSRDVLEAVAEGKGPDRLLVTLGYAGWGAGQLEDELAQNAWLTVAANPHILFETPAEERYPAAMRLLGIDPAMLASDAGHA